MNFKESKSEVCENWALCRLVMELLHRKMAHYYRAIYKHQGSNITFQTFLLPNIAKLFYFTCAAALFWDVRSHGHVSLSANVQSIAAHCSWREAVLINSVHVRWWWGTQRPNWSLFVDLVHNQNNSKVKKKKKAAYFRDENRQKRYVTL